MLNTLVVIIALFWFFIAGAAASSGSVGGARDLRAPRTKPPKPKLKQERSKEDV